MQQNTRKNSIAIDLLVELFFVRVRQRVIDFRPGIVLHSVNG